jgi:hypothetical protein
MTAAQQLDMLAVYFGADLTPDIAAVYLDALSDLPLDALRAGCRRLVLTARFMPKVAEIREAVEAEQVAAHEGQQRAALAAARHAAEPFTVFGRMPKARVYDRFHGFTADVPCDCLACWDAQPAGPPRFIPDGQFPLPICARCDDTGVIEHEHGTVSHCVCVGQNPNLVDSTRAHTVEMGRWIHGAELVRHEQAQAAFFAALKRCGVQPSTLQETRR